MIINIIVVLLLLLIIILITTIVNTGVPIIAGVFLVFSARFPLPCRNPLSLDRSLNDDDSSVTSFGGRRRAFSIGGRGQLPGGGGGGAGGGSASGGASGLSYQHMWPRDYIQDLQQNLALRYMQLVASSRNRCRTYVCRDACKIPRSC